MQQNILGNMFNSGTKDDRYYKMPIRLDQDKTNLFSSQFESSENITGRQSA